MTADAAQVLRARRPRARSRAARVRVALLGVLGVLAVAAAWELYKALGPDDGVVVAGTRVLPRTTDLAMPHTWEMVARLLEPTTSQAGAAPLWLTVAQAALVSLAIAGVGWVVGTLVGVGLGLLMQVWRVAEHGLLPWIVLSQTVPLIAFAPVVRSWGARIEIAGWQWPPWLSVAVIASYLAFFPVAIGTLKGLQSPQRTHLELMHSYGASRWQTLRSVRLPAAVPYLLPALRLGAASALIGTVVARGVHRLPRRHRAPAGGVRRAGLRRSRQGLGTDLRGDRARARGRGPGRARRRGAAHLSTWRGFVSETINGDGVAVAASGVGKTFDTRSGEVQALTGVDLRVAAGEFVSLIGPSGCGKSTLMRLLADLDSPSEGTIEVFGKTPAQARRDQDYGIAFQQAGLLPWRTVAANIGLPLELHGTDRAARAARVAELAELVGLSDFADRYPDQLSGGMQQRVAIARSLAEQPRLLLMDEPFGALDEMTRERMQAELSRIVGESGAAVVFVTHSIPEAVFLSDRVVVMSPRPGRITGVVDIGIGRDVPRDESLRETTAFFAKVTEVREALHGTPVTASGREGR